MTAIVPLFANDCNAAKLLDLKPSEFLGLVEKGLLPRPCDIGGFKRWNVDDLRRIGSGKAADGIGGIQW